METFLGKLFQRVEKVTGQVLAITRSTGEQSEFALSLTDRLRVIEQSALKVDLNIMEIESSLKALERIAADLSRRIGAASASS